MPAKEMFSARHNAAVRGENGVKASHCHAAIRESRSNFVERAEHARVTHITHELKPMLNWGGGGGKEIWRGGP
ncbi:MAG: hypothetical protein FWD61_13260 [Phycisphaerales bacterium]|nr:hypothetical protein [Phycisphaerales bacterium]